jgi:hypothetical protein
MKNKSPHTLPKSVIVGAMVLGMLSAFSFRSLMVLEHFGPGIVKPVWYFGVVGYIFFFLYRYLITRRRKRFIEEHGLIEKVEAGQCLEGRDREVLIYLLTSLRVSREHINYYVIFLLSVLAILADLALRFWG